MEPLIRIALSGDVSRILEIRNDGFSLHAPEEYSAQEVENLLVSVDADEIQEMIESQQLFVAEIKGVVIAVSGWKDDRLRHVYVDPKFERQGIGTQMLRMAENDFSQRTGNATIKAGVGLQAVQFYLRNGYVITNGLFDLDGSRYLEMTKRF